MSLHPARLMPFDELHGALRAAVDLGLVFERTGPGGLRLYGYTQQTVVDGCWGPITELARGLVLDVDARTVVATPFPKFFNYGERPGQTIPAEPFEAFEKLDGSLIILFWWGGEWGGGWRAVTRGSFHSDQAIWAQDWIDSQDLSALVPGTTYLCECIYPENRIIIRYERQGLELLGAYDATGRELTPEEVTEVALSLGWRFAARSTFSSLAFLLAHAKGLPGSEEGYVLRFASGLRLKVKGDEYRRLHALAARVTPLGVWEMMRAGSDLAGIRRDLPEEFWEDYDQIRTLLGAALAGLLIRTELQAWDWRALGDKDVGLRLAELPEEVRKLLFLRRKGGSFLDNERLRDSVFRMLRPTGNALAGYDPSRATGRLVEP